MNVVIGNEISEAEVRAALARLRAFAEFAHSPRLTGFLEYIVVEALEGRGAELRAYSVATSVFGRDRNFDPHNNSIVRVEATRLRKALKSYYASVGAEEAVRIDVPLGGYNPRFARQAGSPGVVAGQAAQFRHELHQLPIAAAPVPLVSRDIVPPPGRSGLYAVALAALVAGGLSFAAIAVHLRGAASAQIFGSEPERVVAQAALPSIGVNAIQVSGDDFDAFALAGHLQRDIANAISRFDEVGVYRAFAHRASTQASMRTDYELQGHIGASAHGRMEMSFRLLHTIDRRAVWSGAFGVASGASDAPLRASLVQSVVTPIAQPFGALISDLRSRLDSATPKSFECIARFEDYWATRLERKRREAFDCVSGAIAAHPDTSAFLVALSNLYVAEYLGDLPRLKEKDSLAAAGNVALQAIRMSPGRAHPYLAMSNVLNLRRDFEPALRLAEHARDINPYDTDVIAQLGALYVLRGRLDEGSHLLRQAMENNPAYPGWMNFYLFLEAYARRDAEGQQQAVRNLGVSEEPDSAFAKVVAAAEAGNLDEAREALVQLRSHFPGFAAAPKQALERLTLAPDIVERLVASAQKVGL